MKLTPKQTNMVAIIAIVGGLVLAGLASTGRLAPILFNPDTQSPCTAISAVTSVQGGGQFPDVPSDAVKAGEIFSRDTGYLSWMPTGTSIPYVAAAKVRSCGAISGDAQVLRYVFSIDNGGLSSSPFYQDDTPQGFTEVQLQGGAYPRIPDYFININARSYSIDGYTFSDANGKQVKILDGAVLKVDLNLGVRQAAGLGGCCDFYNVGHDEMRLLYGTPHVQRGADQYQIGETGRFSWTVPFTDADGRSAYFLTITNENTGAPIAGWSNKPLTTTTGVASFAVTSDLFSSVPGAANRVRARIYSPIFLADVTDVSVIDDKRLAPRVVLVSFNKAEFREGDQVAISYSALPNPQTNSPIARYHVLAHVGGTILYDQDTTSTSVSFVATRTGVLQAEVTAYDQQNRPSPVYEVDATIGNVIVLCEVNPDLPQCGGSQQNNWVSPVVGLVLLIIGVTLILTRKQIPVPGPWIILVVLVAVVLTVAGAALLAIWVYQTLVNAFSGLLP